jgi:serine/threonine-protein kinase RsbT
MDLTFTVEGGNFTKAGHASSEIKKVLKQLNLDPKIIKRAVIALYEAEVNIVAHAYKGVMAIDINPERIMVDIRDEGPGIRDISLAMQEGYSTASEKVREMGFGAGMGLPNIKKNTDLMKLESEVGKGTYLSFSIFLKPE